MGIEIPEEYGGGGGTFLRGILAVRSCRGSTLPQACGGCAEHTGQQCAAALGQRRAEEAIPAEAWRPRRWAPMRLSEAGSGSDAFALQTRAELKGERLRPERPQALDHERQGSGPVHRLRNRRSCRRIQRHHRVPGGKGFPRLHGRQERRQARHSRVVHLRADPRRLPRARRTTCWAKSARATRSPSRR